MRAIKKGDLLFEQELRPSGRERIALFSDATEDPNPIHVDEEFAHRAGFPTVLQQGPMTTAQFALLLEQAAGEESLMMLDMTFTAPVFPDDILVLRSEIAEVGATIRCSLTASKPDGTTTATGEAELKFDGE